MRYMFGIHAVKSIVEHQHDPVTGLYYIKNNKNKRVEEIVSIAKKNNVSVHMVAREILDQYSKGQRHQGVVAELSDKIKTIQQQDLFCMLAELVDRKVLPLLLIVDGVQDPHNLGAILRTADGFGAHAVIVPKDKAVGLTSAVRKVACGAAETLPFYPVTNLARVIDQLKEQGVWVFGTDGETDKLISDGDYTVATAIVVGGEGKGLRHLTKQKCDQLVKIPMSGHVESFNVSVATGIALYEVNRQRSGGQP